jgi:uncharacterized membrane protein
VLHRRLSIPLIALLFILAGTLHFIFPHAYLKQMPAYLPWPRALILISGAFEILGGAGILLPATRRFSGLGLIALLIAVFPVNIHMFTSLTSAQTTTPFGIALLIRLPLQFLLIYWIYRSTIPNPTQSLS